MASSEDIKKIFAKFGNLMIPISILSFIGFIWSLLYWLTAQNVVIIYTTGVIIGICLFIFFVLVFIEIHKAGKLLFSAFVIAFLNVSCSRPSLCQ